MTIASEISRLQTDKECIRQAIIDKGVDVCSNVSLDDYACCIADIPTGGGGGYADYLVIGGGAGGGNYLPGGGAGDAILVCSGFIYKGCFPVVIGSGGGTNQGGGATCFGCIVMKGGCPGQSFGSGGNSGSGYTGGSTSSDRYTGGGGAGSRGNGNSVNGGLGLTTDISGTSVGYAGGGGGGGEGGSCPYGKGCCGGGNGGRECYNGSDASTCGSGGGGAYAKTPGRGGGGLVIVRYKTDGSCGITCATGGCKYTCGDYTIHCFTANDTFEILG